MNDSFFDLFVYKCDACGQMVASRELLKNPIYCCGEEMKLVEPGQKEGATEKHVPVYEMYKNEIMVKIGEMPHPMEEEHRIEWIAILTNRGIQIKFLNKKSVASISFQLHEDECVKTIYSYCNIHGLWSRNLYDCE